MPEYQTPGVYVEEIQREPRPIEGVPTATAAFIGETDRGPITPTLVTSEAEYRSWFGGSFGDGDRYMSHAVHGFFANGGQRLHVCRVVGANAADGAGVEDFIGEPTATRADAQGLAALGSEACRDVALVHAPHPARDALAIARALIAHCERHRFRFAVIDGERGDSSIAALDPRTMVADSSFAAFYHPWLQTADPLSGTPVLVPPGGHVLGIFARIDTERGVFKAPANEVVRGIVDLEFSIGKGAQDVLNPRGVNLIRRFEGRGIRVWGSRTLSSDPEWKYVPIRRLFIFIERSIQQGTQWVAFEPNDASLWVQVQEQIRLFLRTQWRAGALFGTTEEQAFFVRCDRTTMTQNDVDNGRLVCEVGIAPLRPAEFVIFRIVQHTADAER